jgi:hypothetical protein
MESQVAVAPTLLRCWRVNISRPNCRPFALVQIPHQVSADARS